MTKLNKVLTQECGRIDDDESYTNNNYKTRGNVCNIDDLKLQLKQLQTKYAITNFIIVTVCFLKKKLFGKQVLYNNVE